MAFDAAETGCKIRDLREGKKWSQFELGQKMNLTGQYIGRIERGEIIAKLGVYITIAELFEVPLEYLLTDSSTDQFRKKLKIVISILQEMEYEV